MPSIIQRFATSAIDTALQMFWGAILAGLLAGALLVYHDFGGLDLRWADRVTGALVASVFVAIVSIVMTVVRDSKKQRSGNIVALGGTISPPVPKPPPSKPLPTAISPNDRKLMTAELMGPQKLQTIAKLPPFKVRVLYVPSPTTTYVAEELNAIFVEAGWQVASKPELFTGDAANVAKGISVWSSLTNPARVAASIISMALKQIGIKHHHFENVELRQHDFCMVIILPLI